MSFDDAVKRITGGEACVFVDYDIMSDEAAGELAAAIERSTTLRSIGVGIQITDASASKLAVAFGKSVSLKAIYIGGTRHFSGAGAVVLAAAIGTSKTLKCIHLGYNLIGDVGAVALAAAIEKSTSLRCIYLWENPIGDAGAAALVSAVEKSSSLEEFYINNAQEDPYDAAAHAALERSRHRRRLMSLACVDDDRVSNPVRRFIRLDGDHAIGTRTLEFLLER